LLPEFISNRLPLVFGDRVRPRYFSPLGERGGVWPRGPPLGECGVAMELTTKRGGGAFWIYESGSFMLPMSELMSLSVLCKDSHLTKS